MKKNIQLIPLNLDLTQSTLNTIDLIKNISLLINFL